MAERLVLVRHGETEWSRLRQHTGLTDVPLTEHGRDQARALGTVLGDEAFDRILCSPLTRAVETCRLAGLGDRAERCDDLREWDYGVYEGRRASDIRAEEPGWTVWLSPIRGGETLDQIARRADRVLDEVRPTPGTVALFGHGHALRILAARWLDLPPATAARLRLDTASIGILCHERELPVLDRWNHVVLDG